MKRPRMARLLAGVILLLSAGGLACHTGYDEYDDSVPPVCDPADAPIVFLHGAFEVGDAFANQSMRFAANGYDLDRIYAFDWNTLGIDSFSDELGRLEAFIDQVLAETGACRIDLLGHSMGTGLSFAYLSDPAHAAKVAHYANLAGLSADAPPGGVPTITLSSEYDALVGTAEIAGAENVRLSGHDHLEIATSPETFAHLYRFFNDGAEPRTTEMEPAGEVTLSGRLLTLAENQPASFHEMRVYPFDPATGERLQPFPTETFLSDADGYWGPFKAEPGQHYEFEVISDSPFWRPIHYYREPLPRSCNLVYFRTFPSPLSLPGLALALMPYSDDYALLATLNMNRATIAGRDTLFVDGYEISIEEICPPEKTALAIFYFDANSNCQSDGQAAGGVFEVLSFFQGFDLLVEAASPRTIPIAFNGRTLAVRNWKSETEGIAIAVFE